MRVSLIQFDIIWEQPEKNLNILSERLREIAGMVDLVVLPEMFNTGCTLNTVPMAEDINGKTVQWLCDQARDIQAHLIGSLIIEEKKKFYNRLIWASPRGLEGTYDKRHLDIESGENRVFTQGTRKLNISINDWSIIPYISHDLRFPVWIRSVHGEEIMVFIANFQDISAWKTLLKARAIENQCFVIGVNRVGYDGHRQYYPGNSIIADTIGKILVEATEKEHIILYELEYTNLEQIRYELPFLPDKDSFTIH